MGSKKTEEESKFMKLLHGELERYEPAKPPKKSEPLSFASFAASLPPEISAAKSLAEQLEETREKILKAEERKRGLVRIEPTLPLSGTLSTALSAEDYEEWKARSTEMGLSYSEYVPKFERTPNPYLGPALAMEELKERIGELLGANRELRLMLRELNYALDSNGVDCPFCGVNKGHLESCPMEDFIKGLPD